MTSLYFFLYAQVVQTDAASNRNILLFQRPGFFFGRENLLLGGEAGKLFRAPFAQRDRVGGAIFSQAEVARQLALLGLPGDLPLSVLAVEFLPPGVGNDLPPDTSPKVAVQAGGGAAPATAAPAAAAVVEQNPDPLQLNGRPRRILRVSPLVQVAAIC